MKLEHLLKALSKNLTDKNITTGLNIINKRTKAKEPEGTGGKKYRHKTKEHTRK